jgi:hypothetical protein
MIARFDNSRIPLATQASEPIPAALGAEIGASQHSNPLPSVDESSIPVRPIRSLRGKVARDDHFDSTVAVPEVILNASSDSTIRVKRSIRVKKASEKMGGNEEFEFPHKVRALLSSLL